MHLPAEFVRDFAVWERDLRDDGETSDGVEDIKESIRNEWHNLESRELWAAFVKKKAMDCQVTNGVTNRIKIDLHQSKDVNNVRV